MTLTFAPLSDALGVEVTGIDLTGPVSEDDMSAIERALDEHLVMVVRDQKLAPEQYIEAMHRFGEIMPQHLTSMLMTDHPEIAVLDSTKTIADADGAVIPVGAREWHTDHTNHERPPKYTALYAVKLPKSGGGDTGFANMQLAYNALPDAHKAALAKHTVVTKIEDHAYVSEADRAKYGVPRTHPLIRTHPATGRKSIYFHPGKVRQLEGMEPAESLTFLNGILENAIRPEITYRHKWRPDDLVIWDNRAVLHVAHRDYDPAEGRVVQRILVKGEVPF